MSLADGFILHGRMGRAPKIGAQTVLAPLRNSRRSWVLKEIKNKSGRETKAFQSIFQAGFVMEPSERAGQSCRASSGLGRKISVADRLNILRMASDLGPVGACSVYFLSAALKASQKSKLLSKQNPSVSTVFHFETARFLASAPQTPKNKLGLEIKAFLDFSACNSVASSAAKRGLSERRTWMRSPPRLRAASLSGYEDKIAIRQLSY